MSKTFLRAGPTGLHCMYLRLICDFARASPTGRCCRCALIHCHRPDLLDYDKLDKVRHTAGLRFHAPDRPFRQIDMRTPVSHFK